MLPLISVIVFGLLILIVTIYGYKVSAKTAEDYLLASRGLGIIVMLFFVMFGLLSAWTLFAFAGSLYVQGPGFGYYAWGVIVGYASMLILLGPRLITVARLNGFLSPVEVVGVRYESKFVRLSLAIALVAFLTPYIGVQPIVSGLAMEAAFGVPIIYGVLFMTLMMLLIVLLGGMRSVAWVNIFLGVIFIVALFGAFYWTVKTVLPGGLPEAVTTLAQTNPEQLGTPGPLGIYVPLMVVASFIAGVCTVGLPHIMFSTMGARDVSVFKWLSILFILMGGAIYLVAVLFGSLVAPAVMPGVSGESADAILQLIVTAFLPEWMSVFFCIAVIAAAISTAAIQLMGTGAIISRDILYVIKQDVSDEKMILWTRIAMVLVVIASFVASLLLGEQIAFVAIIASSGLFLWLPLLWLGLLWKGSTTWGAIAGIIGGFGYLIAGFIHEPLFIVPFPVMALLVGIVCMVVVSLVTPKSSREILNRFFDEVDEYLEMESSTGA